MAEHSIEASIITWLEGIGYTAFATVPKDRPQQFATVDTAGGTSADMVRSELVTVDVWAQSRDAAQRMANDIAARAAAAGRAGEISGAGRVDVNATPYWLPDTATRMPRYRMLLEAACLM